MSVEASESGVSERVLTEEEGWGADVEQGVQEWDSEDLFEKKGSFKGSLTTLL